MTRRVTNMAASIRARLLEDAHRRGEDFNLTLQRYAAERFLYRLGVSPHHELFVLKGAMLFALWGGSLYRATRDLDLTGYVENNMESLTETIREICSITFAEDGIEFLSDTAQAEPIRDDSDYGGFRVRVDARLDSAEIRLQIDVGFGNAIVPAARDEEYPVLIKGSPRPRIRAYPREAVVAEKLHAVVVLGATNSRMKDFYDLYVLSACFVFEGDTLIRAIATTFERRSTAIPDGLPAGLTPAFFSDANRAAQWRAYLERNGLPGAPGDFDRVGEVLRVFLGRPLEALARGMTLRSQWQTGGPWQ